MASAWIEHIKAFAKSNGMAYKDALKDPKCKSSYQEGKVKGKGVENQNGYAGVPQEVTLKPKEEKGTTKENIQMVVQEKVEEKKRRGRPPKYSTDDERKKAKSAKTMESNKRKKSLKQSPEKEGSESDSDAGAFTDLEIPKEGKGLPNPLKKIKKQTQNSIVKDLVGKGIISAGYKTENANGLGHIYPISHELVLEMIKKYI